MKRILLALILLSNICFGQDLKFDTKFYDAVEKWVVFNKKGKDTTYSLGFIYIDEEAGFTFQYESELILTSKGLEKIPNKLDANIKFRLSPNTANLYLLTDQELALLNLPVFPEWLVFYKSNTNEVGYLTKIGFHYNHVGASTNAIEPLSKAYSLDPHFSGLEFELAYAYNATKDLSKSIEILTKAIEKNPNNFWFYRELGFSYKNLGQIDKAEEIYKKGIEMSDDISQKAEMAVNMAQSYFQLKNKSKFDEWAKITKKYAKKGSQFYKYVEHWKKSWPK